MTHDERLAKVCADGFAKLEALELAMYHRGFICGAKNTRPKVAPCAFGGSDSPQRRGPSPLTVDSPTGPQILSPSGAKAL